MGKNANTYEPGVKHGKRKGRGPGWRTQLFKSMRQAALLGVAKNASDDVVEKAIIKEIAVNAFAGGPESVPYMKIMADKTFPNYKSTHEPVTFDFDSTGTATERAFQILDALAAGDIAPDICSLIMGTLKDVAVIEESTDLKARIEALEELSK